MQPGVGIYEKKMYASVGVSGENAEMLRCWDAENVKKRLQVQSSEKTQTDHKNCVECKSREGTAIEQLRKKESQGAKEISSSPIACPAGAFFSIASWN